METIITEKVKENLNKLKEEDRRFFMGVINQKIQSLQSQHQFKMTFLMSYFAVYLSIISVLFTLGKEKVYLFYIVTIIFCIFVFFILFGKKEGKLIRLQSEIYKTIEDIHLSYLSCKKKK